ncbi:hypothetical protein G4228_013551 [Cervus hanglu yarkandensis]|nr:hypothetical protein G4228_013551 [Cervus hanglu yarkandensis]
MMALAFLYCLIPLVSATSWKENRLSLNIDRGGNLNDCVKCQTNHELVVPITDFDTVPDPITFYNHPPLGVTWQVQLTKEHHNIPVPCFNLSEIISVGGKVTTGPPRSLKFILKKCDEQNPLKCTIDKCVKSKNDTNLCQRAKQVGYHVNGLWKACSGSHPWLDNIISELPKNERINDTTLGGITCSPRGYIFVCGTGSDSPSRGWAHRCLDSWQMEGWEMEGSCLLGYIRMPFALYSLESISSLPKSNTHLKRMILAEYEGNKGQSVLGNLTQTARVYVNRDMTHNLSATIGQIAEDTAKSIAAQHTSLNSLTRVVLGNRIAQDFLLAKQGGVCVMANNTCCTYINTSGEVETQVNRILQKATWLQDVHKEDAHQDLFSWLPSEIAGLF